jgi:hypothetical protein
MAETVTARGAKRLAPGPRADSQKQKTFKMDFIVLLLKPVSKELLVQSTCLRPSSLFFSKNTIYGVEISFIIHI